MTTKFARTHEPKILYSNIANGYSDIALHLGYRPEDVFFMHSLVTDPTNDHDRKFCATDDLDIRAIQYSTGLMGKGSNAFMFPLHPLHHDYLHENIVQGRILTVNPVAPGRLHPGGSIPAALISSINDQTAPDYNLTGKVIINSYATKEVETLCSLTGAKPLMAAENYLPFVSKGYVHEVAEKANLSIAPGIVFNDPSSIDTYTNQIKNLNKAHKAKNSDVWIKAVALSGGQGIVKITNLEKAAVGHAFSTIAEGYEGAGFFTQKRFNPDQPFDGINYFMPIVAELDICSLPGIKDIVINSCVQAVVGPHAITMTGTSLQQTKDGEYVGGVTPHPDQAEPVALAEQEAIKFLKQTHKDGYRGYGGVDVIVARTDNNEMVPFVLEFNPRLNASTPLLSLVQKNKQYIDTSYGQICSMSLPEKNGSIENLFKVIGNDLYRGEKSGYVGVIPTVVDQFPGRDTSFRMVTIGNSAENVEKRLDCVKERIQMLSL